MSERGPFEDMIRRISVLINDHGDGADGWAWDQLRPILEVAGKTNRERTLAWLDLFNDFTAWPNAESFGFMRKEIRALLEALPDGGKK